MASPIVEPVAFNTHVFEKGDPALTVGIVVLTVAITLADDVQPFSIFVLVTVYVVVDKGLAIGLLLVVELNPVEGLHA